MVSASRSAGLTALTASLAQPKFPLSPFPATLTENAPSSVHPSALTPLFSTPAFRSSLTLSHSSKVKSFACHSYAKTPRGGGCASNPPPWKSRSPWVSGFVLANSELQRLPSQNGTRSRFHSPAGCRKRQRGEGTKNGPAPDEVSFRKGLGQERPERSTAEKAVASLRQGRGGQTVQRGDQGIPK